MSPEYLLTGSCNQCGECCLKEPSWFVPDPTKDPACKYLDKQKGKWVCLITAGKFGDPLAEKPPDVPQADFDYWKAECQPYPNPLNEAHCPPYHTLYSKCGYALVVKQT